MVDRIAYIESHSTDARYNLALEEALFFSCGEEECILYLWQNSNTVVIGKNQNVWKECNVTELEEDGGMVVRRMSGGGAVYHDTGNLNFTFLCHKDNYDVDRQFQVIIDALKAFGITAEKTGRNDMTVDGRKISGNAFYEHGSRCYHHGTIMVDVDVKKLSRYLAVSKEKLQSKGIDSVRARVANLKELMPEITIEALKVRLIETFEQVYGKGGLAERIPMDVLDTAQIEMLFDKYGSWDWTFGRKIDFQYEISNRFSKGQLTVQIKVNGGCMEDVNVFSDFMESNIAEWLTICLKGVKHDRREIRRAMREHGGWDEDIIRWISDSICR